jgi:hypothetical protein
VASNRFSERVAGAAIAHAFARGIDDDRLVVSPRAQLVLVRNRSGDVLLELDDDRARTMGAWKVVPVVSELRDGSPSFCRSGAGHPVWGRQWCLDKGFGLGMDNDFRWGRTVDPRDVIIRRPADIIIREDPATALTREVLQRVLGDAAFNRLAVHAITLGLVEPLTGVWLGESTGPRVLLVQSGEVPVAEVVDVNRDGTTDALYVALRPW